MLVIIIIIITTIITTTTTIILSIKGASLDAVRLGPRDPEGRRLARRGSEAYILI